MAAESAAATRVGLGVLDRGGTAVDAAVAMAFTAAVTQPTSCGLGGGGFAMVWDGAKGTVVDFRERAPGGLRLRDHLSTSPPWGKRGVMVGVPGFTAGLAAVHRLGGALTWGAVLGDARDLAAGGFTVEPWLATTARWGERDLRRVPEAGFLLAGDALPAAGDTRTAPQLAATLDAIATGGAEAFYRGPIADDVVQRARAAGSTIVGADLASYAPVTREPLRVSWGGRDVLLAPPPSGGGVALAQLLIGFDEADVAKLGPGTGIYTHLLAEGLRAVGAERRAKVGDPAFTRIDDADLLDVSRLRAMRRALSAETTREADRLLVEDGGTCNVIAWDDDGRVVVITSSIGSMFGAKIVTRGGFFLGDVLTDFAHDPLAAKVATKGPNFPRAGARPVSSMAPTIVLAGGKPELAIGASGGGHIPSAILEVLHRAVGLGGDLEGAVEAPRFHAPLSGGLELEEGLSAIGPDLRARGEALGEPKVTFAAVTAIRRATTRGAPTFEAVADPRKGGAASIWRAPPRSEAPGREAPGGAAR